jgi:hypothetical protein
VKQAEEDEQAVQSRAKWKDSIPSVDGNGAEQVLIFDRYLGAMPPAAAWNTHACFQPQADTGRRLIE